MRKKFRAMRPATSFRDMVDRMDEVAEGIYHVFPLYIQRAAVPHASVLRIAAQLRTSRC